MTRRTAAAAVVPDDVLIAWADTSARLAAELRRGVRDRELASAAGAHIKAAIPFMNALNAVIDEMRAEEKRGKLRLVQGGQQ